LGLQETFEEAGIPAVTVPTLRRDHGGRAQLLHSLAQAFTAGIDVDWRAAFPADPAPRTVELPTYAFQRRRYWATATGGVGDVGAAGLQRVEHPLLRAAVGLADGGLVLTGRVSATAGDGWLADHVVAGASLVPGAALVEWVLRAADEAGCGRIEELALQVPLVLPDSGGLRVQIVVGEAAEDGRREVRVYSRPDRDAEPGADPDWVSHAQGVLSPPTAPSAAEELAGPWPPEGAKPMDVEDFYEHATASGYAYGPSFQGVRAVWRDGADLLAEVALPEAAGDADGFGIHPALLDAALHPMLLAADIEATDDGGMRLPFAWNGVSLWATEATTVRVRLSPHQDGVAGERGVRVVVADGMGAPVLTVGSLTMRPADPRQLRSVGGRGVDGLFTLDWIPVPDVPDADASDTTRWVVLGEDALHLAEEPGLGGGGVVAHPGLEALVAALDDGAPPPAFAVTYLPAVGGPAVAGAAGRAADGLVAVGHALQLVRGWLAEPRLADARLVVVTRGAVSIGAPEDGAPEDGAPEDGAPEGGALEGGDLERGDSGGGELNLAAAGLWGLLRSAQAEHPDRFVLLDLHQATDPAVGEVADAVVRAVRADEPQVALRTGRLVAPRLMRARATDGADETESGGLTPAGLDPDGTVLITGGTGLLGGLVAEHLVRTWQVEHLVLVSRRGSDAPGAPELAERLNDLGARVRIAAVDVTDADAVADAVAGIDPAHPLTGVIHAAGLLDDAVVTSQTREQVARVWAAKATAAAHLHTATADLPLRMFVMFSSAAGVVGNAGQAGYAAANAFVDALVAQRRALGLPGLSLAWGLWARASEMTGHMGRADLTRLRGMRPLSSERGLALLDAACRCANPLMVAVDFDPAGVAGEELPAVLRGLVSGRIRRRAAEGGPSA
ncbi:type I polyketide synthase, partial [Streptomyces rugosispiralis]